MTFKTWKHVRFFNRLDTPSFMPDMRVPLWKSLLIDWGRLFTLGLWKPNASLDGRRTEEVGTGSMSPSTSLFGIDRLRRGMISAGIPSEHAAVAAWEVQRMPPALLPEERESGEMKYPLASNGKDETHDD